MEKFHSRIFDLTVCDHLSSRKLNYFSNKCIHFHINDTAAFHSITL